MVAHDDFVLTIDSDMEDAPQPPSGKAGKPSAPGDDAQLNPDFVFDLTGDPYDELLGTSIEVDDLVKTGSKPVHVFLSSSPVLRLMQS